MMRVATIALVIAVLARPAAAHIGSPDVFYEGDAGPYKLFVAVRMPQVIPGIAAIEIRSETPDANAIDVVPMRLTGPGSEHPPTPDRADRSPDDPQFFTAGLWIMERGSLQVRVTVDGARGTGQLAVPIPAAAQRTLAMDRGLGALLFGLMVVLALAIVSILAGAVREATLPPGEPPRGRRTVVAAIVIGALVVGVIAFGNAWWNAEAASYAEMVTKPWRIEPRVDGCRLRIGPVSASLLPDHGHEMHLFMLRTPRLDRLLHLHPARDGDDFVQELPALAAGRYRVFADIVHDSGFPITGTGEIDLPDLASCGAPAGDDSQWSGADTRMTWDRPAELRAGAALALRFRVVDRDGRPATDLEPYMGMAGHAAIVAQDLSVFAHVHPVGSVAMPALELARAGLGANPHAGHVHAVPPEVSFPYGFPHPGRYKIFVQVKRAGAVETGVFDANVVH